jgi:hypothetical protein
MSIQIRSGGLVLLDPDADEAFEVDWNSEHLPAGVELTSSVWEIAGKSGASSLEQHDDDIGQYDANDAWQAAAAGRVTRVFLTGATGITVGQRYTVTNRIVTDTTPPETKDASFTVLIQQE